jgi:hypothetical protein
MSTSKLRDQLGLLVGPGHRPEAPPAAGATTEDPAEEILEIDVVGAAESAELPRGVVGPAGCPTAESGPTAGAPAATSTARTRTRTGTGTGAAAGARPSPRVGVDAFGHLTEVVPERVVAPACLRIRQHVVRLGDLFEAFLRAGILVDVGVVLAGELAVRALDFLLRCVAADSEHVVVVAPVGHYP